MGISIWQIAIIVLIVVLLFGAGKIPRLMGDVAKGIKSFKSGMKDEEPEEEAKPEQKLASEKADDAAAKAKDETAKTGS
ncbi:MAG: twin-arginine translocase TatA/TatE family subunit [Alphaproteobacteria bacterium]|nr:twin-arginine translocase TatA/TatE family subunit [Alphaproteobacteria bacterium]